MSRPLRYTFILTLFAGGTILAALSGWRYARASAPVNGPILLLSIDALRADHLPAYGYRAGNTPAIDALANDGVVFERAFSHVPQTLPAHASILTGRLPFEHGVRDSSGFALNASERSLPEMLADRGYATAGITSSFLLRKSTGIDQGFGLFDSVESGSAPTAPLVRDGADAERVAERWFDSNGTTRAFLFLHIAEPAVDAAASDAVPLTYDARITKADDVVGRLVRYLKSHQLYDQSTIVLVADHGQGLGAHGEQGHGLLLNDDVLHVPLIIKPAAGSDVAVRVKTPVQHIDIVPTVLDLAKAPVPGNLRGRSLAPLFAGGARSEERLLYAESLFGHYHFGWQSLTSVSDGRYRLVSGSPAQLFDAESPDTDVASSHADVVSHLQRALDELTAKDALPPMASLSDGDRLRLERLGYVGAAGVQSDTDTPGDPAVVEAYRHAIALFAADRHAEAIAAFRALADMAPMSTDIWNHLALTAARAERYDTAADAYRRIVQLAPDDAEGYLALSNALLRLRKYDEAKAQAEKVIAGPLGTPLSVATAHELVARVALARRNVEAARAAARLAETSDPTRPVVGYVEGRIAFDQRRFVDALEAFEPAMAEVEDSPRPLADLELYTAEALLRVDRIAEAEYLFLQQLKDAPLNPRAIAGLAAVYKATGRTDEAVALTQH